MPGIWVGGRCREVDVASTIAEVHNDYPGLAGLAGATLDERHSAEVPAAHGQRTLDGQGQGAHDIQSDESAEQRFHCTALKR